MEVVQWPPDGGSLSGLGPFDSPSPSQCRTCMASCIIRIVLKAGVVGAGHGSPRPRPFCPPLNCKANRLASTLIHRHPRTGHGLPLTGSRVLSKSPPSTRSPATHHSHPIPSHCTPASLSEPLIPHLCALRFFPSSHLPNPGKISLTRKRPPVR